jgi:hypothetical protein
VISFPGAEALPCLFGSGKEAKAVKDGMLYVPPEWFRERPEWERHAHAGLCYQIHFRVVMEEARSVGP